ncbi:oocyte zinc finger protein XlCOF7.1-like [Ranitomeya variabilis]|uniref:oocyte zinc finger protein XlCOF7.1-like n=1 Tax=Ranitomeya variabilis TaxID=490064 RepID=UPI004055EA5A
MDRFRNKMAERILHLTLEILFRLTGEDYTVVKKTSSERCQAPVSEAWGRPLSPITGPSPHPLIHEDINDQKILELAYKMIELLTGEVPIRCQDIAVYFSMDEWEYLEGHKDLYKDVMMEVPQPLTSPVLSSERTTPERSPCPRLLLDCIQENPNVPQDHQEDGEKGVDVSYINTTETYVRGDERGKEEVPTDNRTDDCTWRSKGHQISSDVKADDHSIPSDRYKEDSIIPDIPSSIHSKELSSDLPSFDSSQPLQQIKNNRRDDEHQRAPTGEKLFLCPECGICFTHKSHFLKHQKTHLTKKTFSCSKCEHSFSEKSHLVTHQRSHTGEKPFSCLKCGKCFTTNYKFIRHQRSHTGEKPFACPECRKSFTDNSVLVRHQKIHTGEKPFACSECGKCFINKSVLVRHQKIHTGEKPFLCSECGKYFSQKSNFIKHQKNSHR